MKKVLKFSGYFLLGLCGLIVLAVIILKLISDEQYKAWTTAAAESATGRELAIDGPFTLELGTKIGLQAQDISFSNAEWGSRNEMVTADRLYIQLSLLPLIKGILDLTVELDGPDVLLETNDRGEGNWIFSRTGDTAPEPATLPADMEAEKSIILPVKPYIRNFKIRNFLFAFNNPAADQAIEARLETLRLFVDENEELPLTLSAVYQGSPVILEGTLGNINDWYSNKQTPIVLNGKLNEAAIKIEGTAGPLFPQPAARLDLSLTAANIATFTPFAGINLPELAGLDIGLTAHASGGQTALENIKINLADPQLSVAVTGDVKDLTAVTGINLKAEVKTDQGTALSQKLGALNIESIPDSLFFSAALQGDLESLSMTDLDVSVEDQGVNIKLSGKMENVLKLQGADATLTATVETLDIIGGYIGQELPGFGPIDMSATLISPDNVTQLKSLMINLTDPELSAQISATTGNISLKEQNNLEIDNISIKGSADSTELEGIVKKLGIELPVALPSSFSLKTEAAGNLQKLGIDTLEIAIKDEGVDVDLSATAGNILDQSGINATLTANVASTANLSKFAGMEISDLGSLVLKSQVSSIDETYKLDAFDFQLTGEEIQAKVNATIQDLLILANVAEEQEQIGKAGIDLTLDADVSSISRLIAEITGIEAPDLGVLKLKGHMSSADEMLALESFNLQLEGDDLNAQVKATVKNLLVLANANEKKEEIGAAGIDLSLAADIASISELAERTAGIEMPDLGGLQINGQVNSVEQALQLKSLSAVLKNEELEANIDTTIKNIFTLSGIKTTLSAKIDSLQTLSSLTKSDLPETGPWLLNVRASSDGLNKSPLLFNARLEGEGTQTVVDATIPDIKSPRNMLAKLSVDAESLTPLGNIIDKDLPADEPLKINTNIAVTPGEYSLEKLIILMGQGKLLSDLSYTTPLEGVEGRSRLTGVMSIQNIDITPFFGKNTEPLPETESEVAELEKGVEEDVSKTETDGSKKLFSSEPLATGPLQEYDVDLKLDATDFTINEGFTIDGNVAITLDQGLLRVDPFAFKGKNGGTAEGLIEIDARDAVAGLKILLDFNDFVFPRLGGKFDLDVDLDGKGESVAALMASLNGHFVTNIHDVHMEKSFLSQYGAGLVSQINPLSSDMTTLECAIVRLDVDDGIVDFENKIAAQTTEVTWLGGGEINLKTEELELGIAPTARKAISSMTNLGLASLVNVGGTLAEPTVGLDTMDVAKKYAQYTAHIATGGLSFLAQKAYDNRVSNIDHCKRILADLEKK